MSHEETSAEMVSLRNHLIGKIITNVEWLGSLSIDDEEGYKLTFSDGSAIIFGYWQEKDCTSAEYIIKRAV